MEKVVIPTKRKITFEYEGKSYSMRFPTQLETEEYSEKLIAAENPKEMNEVVYAHLESLGIPKAVSKSMDNEQFDFLMDLIRNPKKK